MATPSRILSERSYLKPPRTEDYLLVTFTLILVLVFLAFAIRPSVLTAYKLYRSIQEYKKIDSILTDKMISLENIRENYTQILAYDEDLQHAIPATAQEGQFLADINALAAQNEIDVASFYFSSKQDPNIPQKEVKLEIQGSYENIKNFLQGIQNLLRLVHITNITMEKSNSTVIGNQKVHVVVTAVIYYDK